MIHGFAHGAILLHPAAADARRVDVASHPSARRQMIALRDKDSGTQLGTITEEELQVLIDALEEESRDDTDYYIETGTIDMLGEQGASPSLIALLRTSLGGRAGMEIAWSRE